MSALKFGGAGEIAPADVKTPCDEFENAIRKIGVVAACEWFGYAADSDFTKETTQWLLAKTGGEA
ncbi:hypothetical protein PIN31009_05570 [Pandoraea iniqua]|uniref:hypothetical protein n=1 Tax=Pandoraea iniqua TaxID=2508288 RepID=UPI00123FD5A6|nr:hypothetical protein [Pandoraea iniqua]VVE59525.1 hypothetical protein PIN31009_05570 [Pandoraea iniqua]